jgi:hypothetical protein
MRGGKGKSARGGRAVAEVTNTKCKLAHDRASEGNSHAESDGEDEENDVQNDARCTAHFVCGVTNAG